MNPLIDFKTTVVSPVIAVVLACFGLLPTAQAVSPPPDGDYVGANTAEGNQALFSLTTGHNNTALGSQALFSLTTGIQNTATGAQALRENRADQNTADGFQALNKNTTGTQNTASGWRALFQNTSGSGNTADGAAALYLNTTGHGNTAVGAGALSVSNADGNTAVGSLALSLNTTGDGNTAIGTGTLFGNTEGRGNTAVGTGALTQNNGSGNTAIGTGALHRNTNQQPPNEQNSNLNTAVGNDALGKNTTGQGNTAVGAGGPGLAFAALGSNTSGRGNTAVGGTFGANPAALGNNTIGIGNTAVGAGTTNASGALASNTTGYTNTALGVGALSFNTTGSDNIGLGVGAGQNLTTGDNNIDIGNDGVAGEAGTIRIGNTNQTATYIAGISAQTSSNGVAVLVNADGKLGTMTSSARFKDEIKPMGKASEAILELTPVSFHYKKDIDPASIPQFGLVAEEVEKVNPDLVVRDKEGKPYTVRYDAVNAMLLNEFLKEHRKVELQDRRAQEQQKEIDALKTELREQKALIQKVSAQLEVSRPAPQTVKNDE